MVAVPLADRTVSLLPAMVFLGIILTIFFLGAAILAAWADRRRYRRRQHRPDVLVACQGCGQMVPEDPLHLGYPRLHRCQAGRDATGHQRMNGGDQ